MQLFKEKVMDETTKILIGTISGFIVAFFAEPVKSFFQNRSKMYSLRMALYNEILNNHLYLNAIYNDPSDNVMQESDPKISELMQSNLIRTNCYEYATSQETFLFYNLKEAAIVNGLYGLISMSQHYLESTKARQKRKRYLSSMSKIYTNQLIDAINMKLLDKKILLAVAGKKRINDLLTGKENPNNPT